MSNQILVIGATGSIGRPLVEALIGKGEQVKAAIYPPELAGYQAQPGVEAVPYDYYKPETHLPALQGVNRAYIICNAADPDPDTALNPFIDMGKETGLEHIVLVTGLGVERGGDKVGYRRVEKHVMASGIEYTFLRPNWFMQIYLTPFMMAMLKEKNAFCLPAGDGKLSFIDARDIASVAAVALTEDGHRGKGYPLTGGEALTFAEGTAIISKTTGRAIQYDESSADELRAVIMKAGGYPGPLPLLDRMYEQIRQGLVAPVDDAVRQVLGRAPITFEQFARDHATIWQEL